MKAFYDVKKLLDVPAWLLVFLSTINIKSTSNRCPVVHGVE